MLCCISVCFWSEWDYPEVIYVPLGSTVPLLHKAGWSQYWSVSQFSLSVVSNSLQPMDYSKPGLSVHYQLQELTQTHVHQADDTIQPSHPLSSPCPPTFNLSQHQGLIQWISSSQQVAKVLLEFQYFGLKYSIYAKNHRLGQKLLQTQEIIRMISPFC